MSPKSKIKVRKPTNLKALPPSEKMLTPMERMALAGLQAEDQAIAKNITEPLRQKYILFINELATRLKITSEELVDKYEIGVDRVIPKPKQEVSTV